MGFMNAILSMPQPGDKIILKTPYYSGINTMDDGRSHLIFLAQTDRILPIETKSDRFL